MVRSSPGAISRYSTPSPRRRVLLGPGLLDPPAQSAMTVFWTVNDRIAPVYRLLIFLLAGFSLARSLFALDPGLDLVRYDIRQWTTGDGLPLNAVTALTGTRDGYLWIGTQEGLARFDGMTFTVFRRRETPVLGDAFISALLEDREGRLWIGTREGLVLYEGGVFSRLTEVDGLPHDYVRTLLVDRRGDLWIGTYGGGVARWSEGRIKTFGVERGLESSIARALHEDARGVLWVGTAGGLFRLEDDVFVAAGEEAGLLGESIRAIAEDAEGILWVATDGGRLLEGREGLFRNSDVSLGAGDRHLSALYRDHHDILWMGTQGAGLVRIHHGEVSRLTEEQGLAHDAVGSFYEDGSGGLWVGTRGGLNRLSTPRILSLTESEGLSGNFSRTILEDRQGNLWIGSDDGGLSLVRGDAVQPFPLVDSLAEENVRSLFEDSSGSLWVGTRAGVLRVVGGRQVRFTSAQGLPNDTVNAIHEGAPGSGILWVGTARGLARVRGGIVEVVSLASEGSAGNGDERSEDLVRCLHRDQQGALWVCTEHGVVRWSEASPPRRFTMADGLDSEFVYAVHEDAEGILWFGTAGGLARFDGTSLDGDFFHGFTTEQGLFSDLIFQILEDEEGFLWLSCARGVFRVSKGDLESVRRGESVRVASNWFGESDGMASSECNGGSQPAGWKARDGRLWFPTIRGVVAFDPKTLTGPPPSPPVIIEGLEADGEVVPLQPGSETFLVPPGRQTLEIRFTAPAFRSPEKVRFRYLLEGYDRRWTIAGGRRSAVYTRLPKGRFQFRASAAYENGAWSPDATVTVVVEPLFFQTSWFRGLVALLVAVGLGSLYRLRQRRLARREERLHQDVVERTNQLEAANRKLERLAAVDPLTGIANQRQFRQILDKEWRRGARDSHLLGLLLIDVDFFKLYNDTYGHLAGDACLIRVSEILSRTLARRAGDLVARYGGEEFAAVLPGTGLEAARQLGENLRQAVENLRIEHRASAVSPWVTVSVGVAAVQPQRDSPLGAVDNLMGEADAALYASKRAGRNRVT